MVNTDKDAQPAQDKAKKDAAEEQFIQEQLQQLTEARRQLEEIKKAGLWEVWQQNTNYRVRESIKTLAKNILNK